MTAKSAQFDDEEVAQQGYLKRLKTGKKRFFVLKKSTKNGKGRLEYYGSHKKFLANASPKKVIFVKDCLHVCQIKEKKHSNVFALFMQSERFGLIADSISELEGWLSAFSSVKKECQEFEGCVKYDEIWSIKIKDEGIGRARNIDGSYHMGLTEESLVILKIPSHEVLHEIHLSSIKRSGQKDRFFFMELGRKSTLGAGELWIEVDESSIAEHMKRAIFGSCNRPRSLTDGSNKEKSPENLLYNRSTSQCETNRNRIGSNFGTLKIPHSSLRKDAIAERDSSFIEREEFIFSARSSLSKPGSVRRPATIDFDSIGLGYEDVELMEKSQKRLTASHSNLISHCSDPANDSDDNPLSDDDLPDDSGDESTVELPTQEDQYVPMHYTTPPSIIKTSPEVDHYSFVSPARPVTVQPQTEETSSQRAEDVYVAMTPSDNTPEGERDAIPLSNQRHPEHHYYNLVQIKQRAESAENVERINLNSTSRVNNIPRPVSVAGDEIYKKRSYKSRDDFDVGMASDNTLKSRSGLSRVFDLRKTLTLSPRSRRAAQEKRKSQEKNLSPSSCFYVDVPEKGHGIVEKDEEECGEDVVKSCKDALNGDEPSYMNVPKGGIITDLKTLEVSNVGDQGKKNGKVCWSDKTVKENVKLKSKARGNKEYETMTFSNRSSEKQSPSPSNSTTERRFVKQVSLPEREKYTPELTRKVSVPPKTYVNVTLGNGVTEQDKSIEWSKMRQGKTRQESNRNQVYTDFTLPSSFNRKQQRSKVSEMFSLTLSRKGKGRCLVDEDASCISAANLVSSRSPPGGMSKCVSYENLLDSDAVERKKAVHGLAYVDLEPVYTTPEDGRQFVQVGPKDLFSKRKKFKISRSCDNILYSVEKEPAEALSEFHPSSPNRVHYSEVDIERSFGMAEAVREQRSNTDHNEGSS